MLYSYFTCSHNLFLNFLNLTMSHFTFLAPCPVILRRISEQSLRNQLDVLRENPVLSAVQRFPEEGSPSLPDYTPKPARRLSKRSIPWVIDSKIARCWVEKGCCSPKPDLSNIDVRAGLQEQGMEAQHFCLGNNFYLDYLKKFLLTRGNMKPRPVSIQQVLNLPVSQFILDFSCVQP